MSHLNGRKSVYTLPRKCLTRRYLTLAATIRCTIPVFGRHVNMYLSYSLSFGFLRITLLFIGIIFLVIVVFVFSLLCKVEIGVFRCYFLIGPVTVVFVLFLCNEVTNIYSVLCL